MYLRHWIEQVNDQDMYVPRGPINESIIYADSRPAWTPHTVQHAVYHSEATVVTGNLVRDSDMCVRKHR